MKLPRVWLTSIKTLLITLYLLISVCTWCGSNAEYTRIHLLATLLGFRHSNPILEIRPHGDFFFFGIRIPRTHHNLLINCNSLHFHVWQIFLFNPNCTHKLSPLLFLSSVLNPYGKNRVRRRVYLNYTILQNLANY